MSLWKGRFDCAASDAVRKFTQSVSFDKSLSEEDIEGSKAHAAMLAGKGIIPVSSAKKITAGLDKILAKIRCGDFVFSEELEDVHMNIEKALTDMIGEDGARLHTARSRNDQVNLDTRMHVRRRCGDIIGGMAALQMALVGKASEYRDAVMPGFTHLQHAQPILFAHHMLAYCEMFERDKGRLEDALRRMSVCPLGSGAIAGTTLPIDRARTAKELGFGQVSRNSMDSVSDRDFLCEILSALAIFGMHVSRLCEDIVLWMSQEFGYIALGEEFCTGSSLMPQKKNPDVAELSRGKSGRLYGNLLATLTICKGLPLAYNRDLQEDKEPLLDSLATVEGMLSVLPGMVSSIVCNVERMARAASDPCLMATDLAEELVRLGVPFRDAHHMVGALVKLSEKKGLPLDKLPLSEARKIAPRIPGGFSRIFSAKESVRRRGSEGGTSPASVAKSIAFWKKRLGTGPAGKRR